MIARIAVAALLVSIPASAMARRLNPGGLSEVQIAPADHTPPNQIVEVPAPEQGTESIPILMPPKPSDDVLDQPEVD